MDAETAIEAKAPIMRQITIYARRFISFFFTQPPTVAAAYSPLSATRARSTPWREAMIRGRTMYFCTKKPSSM